MHSYCFQTLIKKNPIDGLIGILFFFNFISMGSQSSASWSDEDKNQETKTSLEGSGWEQIASVAAARRHSEILRRRSEIRPRDKVDWHNWWLSLHPPSPEIKRRRVESSSSSSSLHLSDMMGWESAHGVSWLLGLHASLLDMGLAEDAAGIVLSFAVRLEASISYRSDIPLTSFHIRRHPSKLELTFSTGTIPPQKAYLWPLQDQSVLTIALKMKVPRTSDFGQEFWCNVVVKKLPDGRFAMHECNNGKIYVVFPMNQTEPEDTGMIHPFDPQTFMEMVVLSKDENNNNDYKSPVEDADQLPHYSWRAIGSSSTVSVPTSVIELSPHTANTHYLVSSLTLKFSLPNNIKIN